MLTGDLVIPVEPHPSGLWMCVAASIAGQVMLRLVLDTGSPVSALSPTVVEDLSGRGLLRPTRAPGAYQLRDLRAGRAVGEPALPNLTVRVLPRLARIQVEGLLGLDFFRLFDRVCFQLSAMQLELTY